MYLCGSKVLPGVVLGKGMEYSSGNQIKLGACLPPVTHYTDFDILICIDLHTNCNTGKVGISQLTMLSIFKLMYVLCIAEI